MSQPLPTTEQTLDAIGIKILQGVEDRKFGHDAVAETDGAEVRDEKRFALLQVKSLCRDAALREVWTFEAELARFSWLDRLTFRGRRDYRDLLAGLVAGRSIVEAIEKVQP